MDASWALVAGGVILVLATTLDVLNTLLVPRATQGRTTRIVGGISVVIGRTLARRAPDFLHADRRLAWVGPAALLAQLALWMLAFLAGFTLLLLPYTPDAAEAIREAGSSMLTLGFATTDRAGATAVDLWAGLSGFGLITLQIAYLPTLYDAFNRREVNVTLLESRAGSPPWGPELLIRHRLVGIEDNLPALFAEWERWAADVAESHTNYPVLVTLRSPHVRRFWVLSLLAVMDAAAMRLALYPSQASTEARLCLRMGFTCLRDIATVARIPFDADPRPTDPIELSFEEFADGVARVRAAGAMTERTAQEAWPDFRGWRVNYESIAHRLAHDLGAPPSPWGGPRYFDFPEMTPFRPAHRKPDDPEAIQQPGTADAAVGRGLPDVTSSAWRRSRRPRGR